MATGSWAIAEPTAGWKREALAVLDSGRGDLVKVRDGVWRDETIRLKVRAQRILNADGLNDRVLLVMTYCRRTWTTARARSAGSGVVLFRPDGTTLRLGLARSTCTDSRWVNALPEGAFEFDDQLRTASMDASFGPVRLDLRWFTGEEQEVVRTTKPGGQNLAAQPDGLKADARRFADVVATVGGDQWWSDCRPAGENIFSPRTSTCELRSVQYANV